MRRQLFLASFVIWAACKHGPNGDESPASDAGVVDIGPSAQGWWRDRVFYEVFVRSFADSDGDGVGDFRGLTAQLDALNDGDPNTATDLGVDGIWLMPIHPTPSYHGYDVTDYRGINPDYGTPEDFDTFLVAAHARGIKVIIDFVVNHSSKEHPWFVSAAANGPYRDYYVWRNDNPGWTQPWGSGPVWHAAAGSFYYAIFWSGMPDLNLGNQAVENEMVEAMRFWLARGVDGFRVDAARHFFESADGQLSDQPENHPFVKRLRARLQAEYPEVLLVAEAWTTVGTVAQYYGEGDEYHLAFGFDSAAALKSAAKDGLRASYNQVLQEAERAYADRGFEAPFLANHDMPRTLRALEGDAGAMRVAAAALFSLPGTPFIYYGEELGMQGGASSADEDKRTPYRWNAQSPNYGFSSGTPWRSAPEAAGVDLQTQRQTEGSLWRLFQALIRVRKQNQALSLGGAQRLPVEGGGRGVATLLREHKGQRVLFVVNFHSEASGPFSVAIAGQPTVLLGEGVTSVRGGDGLQIDLGPRGFAFLAY